MEPACDASARFPLNASKRCPGRATAWSARKIWARNWIPSGLGTALPERPFGTETVHGSGGPPHQGARHYPGFLQCGKAHAPGENVEALALDALQQARVNADQRP